MNSVTMKVGEVVPTTFLPVMDANDTPTPGAIVTDERWTSSDTAVATVDADGNVTAVAPGTATITDNANVTDQNSAVSNFTASGTVTVTDVAPPPPTPVSIGAVLVFGTPTTPTLAPAA